MKKNVGPIIYAILSISALISLILILLTNQISDVRFYVGLLSLLVIAATKFILPKASNYVFAFILILGTLNLITFSHMDFRFSLTFVGVESFAINPILLIFACLFLVSNKKIIQTVSGSSNIISEEERIRLKEQRIEGFIKKHEDNSIEQLQDIIDNQDKYVEHVYIAAQRLLKEKKNAL